MVVGTTFGLLMIPGLYNALRKPLEEERLAVQPEPEEASHA
jgi:hypothetical protein